MFVTKMFGVLALAVLAMSATTERQDDSNPEPRMMTWKQHRADLQAIGWTIIQQRNDVDDTTKLFREADWEMYRNGFWNLDISNKSFDDKQDAGYWMGLEKIHQMTEKGNWQLLKSYEFDREKTETANGGVAVIIYNNFKVADELQFYRLTLPSIQSYKGQYMPHTNYFTYSNDKMFSTRDRDADTGTSCANDYEGGWWFGSCAFFCSNCRSTRAFHSYTKGWMPVKKTVMAIKPMPVEEEDKLI